MTLEARYRRLIAVYPSAYRHEYEDEMVGVLLAGACPGRRRPSPRDVLDVLTSAAVIRWRLGIRGMRSELWRRAAYVVQVFGAVLLFGVALRRVALDEVWRIAFLPAGVPFHIAPADWARPAAWLAVLIATLAGRRVAGAGFAVMGATAEIAAPARLYADTPALLLDVYWIIVTALVVVGTSALARRGAGPRLPRGTLPLGLAGVALVASAPGELLPGSLAPGGLTSGLFAPIRVGAWAVSFPAAALLAVAAVLAALSAWRLEPPIRRRLLVCAVPILVTVPLVRIGFGGLIANNQLRHTAVLLGPLQWAALVIIPAAALHRAAALNRRLEQARHSAPEFLPHPTDPPVDTYRDELTDPSSRPPRSL
jgi:hypothetical protein